MAKLNRVTETFESSDSTWRIEADRLIPGRGDPIQDATLLVAEGIITFAGSRASAPPVEAGEVLVDAPVVMPGLWDCHTHLLGLSAAGGAQLSRVPVEPAATRAARCVSDLRAALAAGVTSVRDLCGLGTYLFDAQVEGSLVGPTIYAAGAMLSTTGGHGDLHDLPLPWVVDYGHSGGEFRPCDGEAECAKGTREQLRKGARVIKICASGGGMSVRDDPRHQQFTVSEMRTIVEVAAMADRVVAAHCTGKAGAMAALQAGVTTIEHGVHADDEVCAAMLETGAILVPTFSMPADLRSRPALPEWMVRKGREIAEAHHSSVALAHSKGVTIAMGSDIFFSGVTGAASAWGTNGQELALMGQLGMSPLAVIEAATANGPKTVGPQAPKSGLLAAGFEADFLTLDRDPLADLSVLADPSNVSGVWQAGRRVKDRAACL